MSATTSTPITYGDFSFDLAALPAQSVSSLVRKGLAHYLGNEQASKVTAWKATDEGKQTPDETDADYATRVDGRKNAYVKVAVDAVLEGTIGANVRGPRVTPVESIARRIAESEIKANLAKAKGADGKPLAMPRGDGTITIGANNFTRAQLIDRRLAHAEHGPRIRKAAEKEAAALAKLAAAPVDGDALADL